MKAYTKIKLKLFLLTLCFELIVNSAILFTAYFVDKLLETLLFYVPFHFLRKAVPKVLHIKAKTPLTSILGCAFCSYLCYFVAIKLFFPLGISLFSSVLVGIIINFGLYKIEDYLDLRRKQSTSLFDLCKMSEDELRAYAISKHVNETLVDTLVLRLKHNYRWCDIRDERGYTKEGIRYHKETLERILGIKL